MAGPDIESNGATHGGQGGVGDLAAPTTEAHAEAVPPFVIFLSQEECAAARESSGAHELH